MADVINLPGAAAEPIVQHRRRGSYGRKVASLNSARRARAWQQQRSCEQPANADEEKEQQRLLDAEVFYATSTRGAPIDAAAHIERLDVEKKLELLTTWTCTLMHVAVSLRRDLHKRT